MPPAYVAAANCHPKNHVSHQTSRLDEANVGVILACSSPPVECHSSSKPMRYKHKYIWLDVEKNLTQGRSKKSSIR